MHSILLQNNRLPQIYLSLSKIQIGRIQMIDVFDFFIFFCVRIYTKKTKQPSECSNGKEIN